MSALLQQDAEVSGVTFDPETYIIDTLGLTLEERGALMLLRMTAQHRGYAFLSKEIEVMRTLGIVRHQWKRMAPKLLPLLNARAGEIK